MKLRGYLLVVFFLFLLLGLRMEWVFSHLSRYSNGQQIRIESALVEEPQIVLGKQRFSLNDSQGTRMSVVTSMGHFYAYGDRLLVTGKLQIKQYKGRVLYVLNFPKIIVQPLGFSPVVVSANWLRRQATELYQSSLSAEDASLLLGIVFGGNQGLESDFMKTLRSAGVVHVIAASGMNVTFVAGALIAVLGSFLPRRVALLFGMGGVIFYGFLAGFGASVLRASVMALLAFGAGLWGRQYYSVSSLFLTAFVILLYSPILIVDIGFWLSFLSTVGILVIQPLFFWGRRWYLADLATTLSAQIATLPVMFGVFGQYGVLSLVVNGMVLWMIPFLMTIGATALLVSLLLPLLGKMLLFSCVPFLWFFTWVVGTFGGVGLVWSISSFPITLAFGYYFLLAAVITLVKVKNQNSKIKNTGQNLKAEL